MKRNIGDRTFELIKQEKERYKRLQDFIKNNEPISGIIADTNYLIKLNKRKYYTDFNVNESKFSLKAYKFDEDRYIYDYKVFPSLDNADFYKGIILTSINLHPIYEKVYKFDKSFLEESLTTKAHIFRLKLFDTVINKTFTLDGTYGRPFIVYSSNNVHFSVDNRSINELVNYYSKEGKKICTMGLTEKEWCSVYLPDGMAGARQIEEFIKKNISSDDDPTKLVEMAGYYNSSENFHNLVKKI